MARVAHPVNPSAADAADKDFYARHPELVQSDGTLVRPSSGDPEQEQQREEWLQLYAAYGGKVQHPPLPARPINIPKHSCPARTVTGRIVSLTFRSDHLDSAGGKLLRPTPGDYKDTTKRFKKPDWESGRSVPDEPWLTPSPRSDPISHTKARRVIVDIVVEFVVLPAGCSAAMTKLRGTCSDSNYLTFERAVGQSVTTERISFTGLMSRGALPNHVTLIDSKSVNWYARVDGKWISVGTTGPHTIYVTYDQPRGAMIFDKDKGLAEQGTSQHVTEERLKLAVGAADDTGKSDEKECVDAVFKYLGDEGIHYEIGYKWNPEVNMTGINPPPTLHQYLWRLLANTASGQCNYLAAAFMLCSRILGVSGPMEIGYMYPWPSRKDVHPSYPKRGDHKLGAYGKNNAARYRRVHAGERHGEEYCRYLDSKHRLNTYEGVVRYREALYPIGESKLDYGDVNVSASVFFAGKKMNAAGEFVPNLTKGAVELCFFDDWGPCKKPYPWTTVKKYWQPGPPGSAGWWLEVATFYWED